VSVKVSIIIPAYNAERYLRRAVGSALTQTYDNCEIIIVDDGSTDGTASLADTLARQYERVRVVHQPNRGLAEARRTGVETAQGEYITHLDADDELTTDAITFLLNKCLTHQLDIAYGAHIKIHNDGSEHLVPHPFEGILTGEEYLQFLFDRKCMCASWGNVSRRDLWRQDIYPHTANHLPNEDVLMNICLSQYVNHVGFYNTPTYRYYYIADSLSVTGRLSNLGNWMKFFELIESNLQARKSLERYQDSLLAMKIDRLAFYVYPLDTSNDWVKSILHSPSQGLSPRHRLLQRLIRHPQLFRWLLDNYRKIKQVLR